MWPFRAKRRARPRSEGSDPRAELLWTQGMRFLGRRRFNKAIECFEEARAIEPSRLDGRLNLGAAYFLDGQPAEALPHLRYVLAIEPQNTAALLNLAAAHDALGELEKSIELLESLVAARPGWADANYNLAVAYVKKERIDDAITALGRELAINPKNSGARTLLNELHLRPKRDTSGPSPYLRQQLEAEEKFQTALDDQETPSPNIPHDSSSTDQPGERRP